MKKMLLMVCLALLSGAVCSCSDDDGGNDGGNANASVSINGQDVKFSYAYYATASDGECEIMFSNFRMSGNNMPKRYSMLMISVPAQNGSVPTGTFSNAEYAVTLMVNADWDSEGNYDYYLDTAYQQGGNLVISKDGGDYTITINNLRLEGAKGNGEEVSVATSFSYTGALQKVDLDIE